MGWKFLGAEDRGIMDRAQPFPFQMLRSEKQGRICTLSVPLIIHVLFESRSLQQNSLTNILNTQYVPRIVLGTGGYKR